MKIHPRLAGGIYISVFCIVVIILSKVFARNFFNNKFVLFCGIIGAIVVYEIFDRKYKWGDKD